MLYRDVTDGVHRIGEFFVNWYIVEENGYLTLVDAGFPASWQSLMGALDPLGHTPGDIEAARSKEGGCSLIRLRVPRNPVATLLSD